MSTTVQNTRSTNRFSQSLGGSVKSMLSPGKRTYFILEFKTHDEKHKIGQNQEFIGDYVELGRGNAFAVNFGNDCPTVSRPHAAICRQHDGWVLQGLSKTNPTLLNGRSISNPLQLNNGDEIQLSLEGPKMAFLLPANNSVNKLGMTTRLKALVNESVRPYRNGLIIVCAVALALIVGLAIFMGRQNVMLFDQIAKNKAQQRKIDSTYAAQLSASNASNKELQQQLGKLSSTIKNMKTSAPRGTGRTAGGGSADAGQISALYPNVYFISVAKMKYQIGDEENEIEVGLSATGFLLNDGRFVTARHVVEPWYFWSANEESDFNTQMKLLNLYANNGGKVTCELTAYSSTGQKLTFQSNDFFVNRSGDDATTISNDGTDYVLKKASSSGGQDWAYIKTSKSGGLPYNYNLSSHLTVSSKLAVLGFPFAIGASNSNDIHPIYSECVVSRDGIDNGNIDISSKAFDHGNSGGPAFILENGKYVVVGIISAELSSQGFIVPISAINR